MIPALQSAMDAIDRASRTDQLDRPAPTDAEHNAAMIKAATQADPALRNIRKVMKNG